MSNCNSNVVEKPAIYPDITKLPKDVNKDGKIFVVGIARSGTTLLQQLIATHSDVAGINETAFLKKFDTRLKTLDTIVERIAKTEKEAKIVKDNLQGFTKHSDPYVLFDRYCDAQRKYFNKKAYVEKSPLHSHLLGEILEYIPCSKLIIIVRDPRAVVLSRLNTTRISRGKTFILPRKIQFYLNLSEVVFTYRFFNRYFTQRGYSKRILFIKYEDLCSRPENVMRKVFSFLGLEYENVYEYINPTDLRLLAESKNGLMNSSFGAKKINTISSGSLDKWKKLLTYEQIKCIEGATSFNNLELLKEFYPEICPPKNNFKDFLINLFSRLDYRIFLHKNIKEPQLILRRREIAF